MTEGDAGWVTEGDGRVTEVTLRPRPGVGSKAPSVGPSVDSPARNTLRQLGRTPRRMRFLHRYHLAANADDDDLRGGSAPKHVFKIALHGVPESSVCLFVPTTAPPWVTALNSGT